MKTKLLILGLMSFVFITPSFGQDKSKMSELKAKMTEAAKVTPALKTLDADNKKLATDFEELLKKNGYTPQALTCETTCSVSCTWVNGQCQPTTTCSLTCR